MLTMPNFPAVDPETDRSIHLLREQAKARLTRLAAGVIADVVAIESPSDMANAVNRVTEWLADVRFEILAKAAAAELRR